MAKKAQPLTDERNYVVTTSAGERKGNLTRQEAMVLAKKRRAEWQELGRTVAVRVFYNRTGAEVDIE